MRGSAISKLQYNHSRPAHYGNLSRTTPSLAVVVYLRHVFHRVNVVRIGTPVYAAIQQNWSTPLHSAVLDKHLLNAEVNLTMEWYFSSKSWNNSQTPLFYVLLLV